MISLPELQDLSKLGKLFFGFRLVLVGLGMYSLGLKWLALLYFAKVRSKHDLTTKI